MASQVITIGPLQSTRRATPGSIWRAFWKLPVIPTTVLMSVLVIPAVFSEWLAPYDPLIGNLSRRLTPPFWMEGGSTDYLLGTDKQGRDILSRLIHGARISFSVSMVVVILTTTFGVALGMIAGFFGGKIDRCVMWVVDTFLSTPFILMALVIVSVLGPGYGTMLLVASLFSWIGDCRQIRGETLTIKGLDYIQRAHVAGSPWWRILRHHILPNVSSTVIVLATLQVGSTILLESTLSFLGLGIPRPQPSWGVMVADGRDHILGAWWLSFLPGLCIMLTVFSVNLLGDWLRDHLDPKLRQST